MKNINRNLLLLISVPIFKYKLFILTVVVGLEKKLKEKKNSKISINLLV